jgi:hypothetical protein
MANQHWDGTVPAARTISDPPISNHDVDLAKIGAEVMAVVLQAVK